MKRYLLIIFCVCLLQSAYSQRVKYIPGVVHNPKEASIAPVGALYTQNSYSPIAPSASIQKFTPIPNSQGSTAGCNAWASTYCIATILWAQKNAITDRAEITRNAFLPAMTYLNLKIDKTDCKQKTIVPRALNFLKNVGCVHHELGQDLTCIYQEEDSWRKNALENRISNFKKLFDEKQISNNKQKIMDIKYAIFKANPVEITMVIPPSFYSENSINQDGLWTPLEDEIPDMDQMGLHAMVVVAYDDNKDGGAFLVQNSWGTSWGLKGYCWIRYNDFLTWVNSAYSVSNCLNPDNDVAVDYNCENLDFSTSWDLKFFRKRQDNSKVVDKKIINESDSVLMASTKLQNSLYKDDSNDAWKGFSQKDISSKDIAYVNNMSKVNYTQLNHDEFEDYLINNQYNTRGFGIVEYENGYVANDSYKMDFASAYSSFFKYVDGSDTIFANAISGSIRLLVSDNTYMEGKLDGNTININKAYPSGTRFRVIVTNNQPCYVYVFGTDLTNEVYHLFPQSKLISPYLEDRNVSIALPSEQQFIQMDDKKGTDYLYVLFSKVELNYVEIEKQIKKIKANYQDKIFDVLGPKTCGLSNSRVAGVSNFRFGTILKDRQALAIVVKINHQ